MNLDDFNYVVLVIMQDKFTEKFFHYPIGDVLLSLACENAARYFGDKIVLYDRFGNYYPIKK